MNNDMDAGDQNKPMRVYADTSVFGGTFDRQFKNASRRFFEEVSQGGSQLVLSALTVRELLAAPERVRSILDAIAPERLTIHDNRLRGYKEIEIYSPLEIVP